MFANFLVALNMHGRLPGMQGGGRGKGVLLCFVGYGVSRKVLS